PPRAAQHHGNHPTATVVSTSLHTGTVFGSTLREIEPRVPLRIPRRWRFATVYIVVAILSATAGIFAMRRGQSSKPTPHRFDSALIAPAVPQRTEAQGPATPSVTTAEIAGSSINSDAAASSSGRGDKRHPVITVPLNRASRHQSAARVQHFRSSPV